MGPQSQAPTSPVASFLPLLIAHRSAGMGDGSSFKTTESTALEGAASLRCSNALQDAYGTIMRPWL